MKIETFRSLVNIIHDLENGITNLETSLKCTFENNWLTEASNKIVESIISEFISDESYNFDSVCDIIYNLIYRNSNDKYVIIFTKTAIDPDDNCCIMYEGTDDLFKFLQLAAKYPDAEIRFDKRKH